MALPVMPVKMPAAVTGYQNGRLPDSLLVVLPGRAGGPKIRLGVSAARCWAALEATAARAGHVLKATSYNDSYRDYSAQVATFTSRYTTEYLAGRPWRMWQGVRWYQKPNTAVAAVPGTSNHGWALAVDVGEERDGDAGTESIDQNTVDWLVANAFTFGFSAELQSEPWHWRCFIGDAIPAAVLLYEKGEDMTPEQERLLRNAETYAWKETVGEANVTGIVGGDGKPVPPFTNVPHQQRVDTLAKLDQLLARPAGTPPPADLAAQIAAELAANDAFLDAIAQRTADVQAARLAE